MSQPGDAREVRDCLCWCGDSWKAFKARGKIWLDKLQGKDLRGGQKIQKWMEGDYWYEQRCVMVMASGLCIIYDKKQNIACAYLAGRPTSGHWNLFLAYCIELIPGIDAVAH